jgi:hypothetical protein
MAALDAETLLPSERMKDQALDGEVTQIHRGQQYADEGDTFAIDGTQFEVVEVSDTTLGALTDDDARAEGARDLDNFEWDDDSDIVLHRFERQ